ncbi:hypothetical protein [Desulfovibrio inopinatus]|uniref:hypothetical protein n=1 Tax=Desulfovibrio inopinatus TaxID=102109 RepID=UPI000414A8B2|nr:hypothetical protein [Desulfovibrio inopinatus]
MIDAITTSNALLAYQRQQAPTYTRSVEADTAESLQKAKVVTRSFGLKLGKFGIDYTTRDVELPNSVEQNKSGLSGDASSDNQKSGLSRYESFESFLEAASLRNQLYQSSADTDPKSESMRSGGGHSALRKRLGLAAYSNSIETFDFDNRGGKSVLLAVA